MTQIWGETNEKEQKDWQNKEGEGKKRRKHQDCKKGRRWDGWRETFWLHLFHVGAPQRIRRSPPYLHRSFFPASHCTDRGIGGDGERTCRRKRVGAPRVLVCLHASAPVCVCVFKQALVDPRARVCVFKERFSNSIINSSGFLDGSPPIRRQYTHTLSLSQ